MEQFIHAMLESMVSHNPQVLPLTERYSATENGKPAALCHMTCWRTITAIQYISQLVQDRTEHQILAVVNVKEGDAESLLSIRLKIVGDKISEVELYLLRSRAEAGFWYAPADMNKLPAGWHSQIPEGGRALRQELMELAKAIFDPRDGKMYFGSEDNYGMENGGVVYEHIDYITGMAAEGAPQIDPAMVPPSGRLAMPLPMLFPIRPFDPNARILAVDEEQGIVAAFGMVDGYVSPYIVADEVSSCFVPEEMIAEHRKTLTPKRMAGKCLIHEMRATGMTTQIMRFHSGKIQGIHQIIVLSGYGTKSTWN